MDVTVWNALHDGELVAADGSVPDDLRLTLGIAYLCGHLPTRAGHLTLTLAGCEWFEYRLYEEPPVTDPATVAALGLELLSAAVIDGAVHVECADGGAGSQLVVRYAAAPLATAEGVPLSQAELETAADRYWTLWEERHTPPANP